MKREVIDSLFYYHCITIVKNDWVQEEDEKVSSHPPLISSSSLLLYKPQLPQHDLSHRAPESAAPWA